METYVQETLIRQQIATVDRTAALHHLARAARAPRPPLMWWSAIQRFVRTVRALAGPSAEGHGLRETRRLS
jgi:hypothetical protein